MSRFSINTSNLALFASPVKAQNANERFLELLVDERVAERVDGTVEIAQPVRDIVEQRRNTRFAAFHACATEPNQQREYVPRRPAENERSEDDGDGAQSLACSVLVLLLLLATSPFALRQRAGP